ncbi:MAG: zinc-ribbon domain-containing protein [Ignavibacteriae bacterium]|nr:zinc-ribbon domain-containing protein [Ignavibacteriota bacterium]
MTHVQTHEKTETYSLCPNCGNFAAKAEGHKFCVLCGTKMIDQCPQCGEPIRTPTAKFCPKCGGKYQKVIGDGAQG